MRTDGQTFVRPKDMSKLVVPFLNPANTPKNGFGHSFRLATSMCPSPVERRPAESCGADKDQIQTLAKRD